MINYLGPECENKCQTKQDFVDHAFCKHPEGAQALLALKDDITDIHLPGIYQHIQFEFCEKTASSGGITWRLLKEIQRAIRFEWNGFVFQ